MGINLHQFKHLRRLIMRDYKDLMFNTKHSMLSVREVYLNSCQISPKYQKPDFLSTFPALNKLCMMECKDINFRIDKVNPDDISNSSLAKSNSPLLPHKDLTTVYLDSYIL